MRRRWGASGAGGFGWGRTRVGSAEPIRKAPAPATARDAPATSAAAGCEATETGTIGRFATAAAKEARGAGRVITITSGRSTETLTFLHAATRAPSGNPGAWTAA